MPYFVNAPELAMEAEMTQSNNPYSEGLAYIQGEFVPLAEASVPIVEAGFTRSDATYDVVATWQGRFFRLDEHLERFRQSYTKLRMELPLEGEELRQMLLELVGRSGLRDSYVMMIATRGLPPAGSRDPRRFQNRLYAFACPYLWVFSPELQERGIKAVISSIIRTPPRAFDPTIKNFQWGDLIRGQWQALEADAEAGLLLDDDGNVTEGAGYNVLAFVDGVLRTPEEGALLGITRRSAIELAEEDGIPVKRGLLHVDELRSAEEIFFTTTAGGVMPVGMLDGKPIGDGDGSPGPKTLRLKQLYWDAHERPEWSTEVDYSVADPSISAA
ncbi:MAG: aminotransferase class IV [Solirubrobacterales bacterium]